MMRFLNLIFCLCFSTQLLASTQVEVDSKKVLKLTFLEHDLPKEKRPLRMYFESEGVKYKLCDSDGGAMIALVYALCTQELRQYMSNLDEKEAKSVWKEVCVYESKLYKPLHPFFIHSINRLMGSKWAKEGDRSFKLGKMRDRMEAEEKVTYTILYRCLGRWLRENYKSFKAYPIDITEGTLRPKPTVMGIQFFQKETEAGYTCVGNTLSFLCNIEKFETPVSMIFGAKELIVDDLDAILTAYHIARTPDQNIISDVHEHKTVIKMPDGSIVTTIVAYPDRPAPKVAYTKPQAKMAESKRANKKYTNYNK